MKLSRDQEFYWHEPLAFSRARGRSTPPPNSLVLFAGFTAAFSVLLALVKFPSDFRSVSLLAGIAVTGAALFAFGLIPLATRMPNSVFIGSNRLVVGKQVFWFKDISHVVVGAMRIGEETFPVVSIWVSGGQPQVFGLGRKVDPGKLSAFFMSKGLHEPQS